MIKRFMAKILAQHILDHELTGYEMVGEEGMKFVEGTRQIIADDEQVAQAVLASVGINKSISQIREEGV